MTRNAKPVHPGRIIRQEFLEPAGISQAMLAKASGMSVMMVNHILNERRGITAETALRLEGALGVSAQTWLNLQTLYDLETTEDSIGPKIRASTVHLSLEHAGDGACV